MPMNFKLEIAWCKLIKSLAVGQSVVLFSNQAQYTHHTLLSPNSSSNVFRVTWACHHTNSLIRKTIDELIKSETIIAGM